MPKLTNAQIAAISNLTLQVEWKWDGEMTWNIHKTYDDGTVMITATNIHSHDHHWFCKMLSFSAFVSPRGRVTVSKYSDWRAWGAREVRLRAGTFAPKKPVEKQPQQQEA